MSAVQVNVSVSLAVVLAGLKKEDFTPAMQGALAAVIAPAAGVPVSGVRFSLQSSSLRLLQAASPPLTVSTTLTFSSVIQTVSQLGMDATKSASFTNATQSLGAAAVAAAAAVATSISGQVPMSIPCAGNANFCPPASSTCVCTKNLIQALQATAVSTGLGALTIDAACDAASITTPTVAAAVVAASVPLPSPSSAPSLLGGLSYEGGAVAGFALLAVTMVLCCICCWVIKRRRKDETTGKHVVEADCSTGSPAERPTPIPSPSASPSSVVVHLRTAADTSSSPPELTTEPKPTKDKTLFEAVQYSAP